MPTTLVQVEPQLRSMARSINPRWLDDLVQEGRIAAWRSERTYDASRGLTAQQYARLAAREAMHRYIRDRAAMIRIPRPVWEHGEQQDPVCSIEAISPDSTQLAGRHFVPFLLDTLCPPEPEEKPAVPRHETARQIEILRLLTVGEQTQAEAAATLGTTPRIVRHDMQILFQVWGVKGFLAAYNEAMRRGLVEPPTRRDNGTDCRTTTDT